MKKIDFARLCLLAGALMSASVAFAQSGMHTRTVLTGGVNGIRNNSTVTLYGNTRPEATAPNDRGAVAGDMVLEHVLLQLKHLPEQEQALRQFIDGLHDPASANFHKWLTAAQFGQQFGVAQQDLDTLSTWLQSYGLTVNSVYPSGMLIDFSGPVSAIRNAFRTEIHNLDVNGQAHLSNMSDPQIPADLEPLIAGVVSLNDFKPSKLSHPRTNFTFNSGNSTYEAVVPADLATIYNLNPLFSAGFSGRGQTIVVIEDTNVYTTADWTTFRKTFGLTKQYPYGSFTQVHPSPGPGGAACTNPGVNGDDSEAILDAEWATAAAPNAAIVLASCSGTRTTFGGLIALNNLLSGTGVPQIVSISYGESEELNGAAQNAAYNASYQQAVAEGVSVFVSSGDQGAASSDGGATRATHGITISGFTSTPYNISVGGLDFADTYFGTSSTYWNAANGPTYGSAKSYIPEQPWNDSCASEVLTNYLGYATTYGVTGFCNSSLATTNNAFLLAVAGSGGPSGCATGTPGTRGVNNGSCVGYSKPSWQKIVGNLNDGVRDIPDVSLMAANGLWGHYYVFCYSDPTRGYGGASCQGDPSTWSGAGGTSFASPIMAGIQALVNQYTGQSWGNANTVYYKLAANEYGASGNSSCNSILGNGVASNCLFYDITLGDIDVNCTGGNNCYLPSGTNGVLSTLISSYQVAYATGVGWDFSSGIGSVNAYNLVTNWWSGVSSSAIQSGGR